MASKVIELREEIKIQQESQTKIIAYLNARIDTEIGFINFGLQIMDKVLLEQNLTYVKQQYDLFINDMNTEAYNNGWLMFQPIV